MKKKKKELIRFRTVSLSGRKQNVIGEELRERLLRYSDTQLIGPGGQRPILYSNNVYTA